MTKQVRVSVIIIFLNGEKFMQEAIESVFAQTYVDWELLLVDDGSTDGSTKIAREYSLTHAGRVRYLEHLGHQNRGMSASRNLGIRHAAGKYVAFLDADDIWLPQKLQQQVGIMESHPKANMLYGNTLYWYSWTGDPEDEQRDFIPALGVEPEALIDPPDLLPLFLRGEAAVPCTCSLLVRREALDRVGAFEEAFRGMYEDQAFYAKMVINEPVFVSGGCLERYRQHQDSRSAVTIDSGLEDKARLAYLDWLENYLHEQAIDDAATLDALHWAKWQIHNPRLARLFRTAKRLAKRLPLT